MCDGRYAEEIWWGRLGLLSSTLSGESGDSRLIYCLRYMYLHVPKILGHEKKLDGPYHPANINIPRIVMMIIVNGPILCYFKSCILDH